MSTFKVYDNNNFIFIEGIDSDVYISLGKATVQIVETAKDSNEYEIIRTSDHKKLPVGNLVIGNIYDNAEEPVLHDAIFFREWVSEVSASFSRAGLAALTTRFENELSTTNITPVPLNGGLAQVVPIDKEDFINYRIENVEGYEVDALVLIEETQITIKSNLPLVGWFYLITH